MRLVDGTLRADPPAAAPAAAPDAGEQLRLFDVTPYETVVTPVGRRAPFELDSAALASRSVAERADEVDADAASSEPAVRIRAIDVARGLAVAGMIFVENLPGPPDTFPWWRHAAWHGWTGADLVFPAFLAIVGASLAFTTARPVPGRWRRLARRAVTLVAIGLLFNAWSGDGADLSTLRIPGVLQRIALVGVLTAVLVTVLRRRRAAVLVAVVVLLAGYGAFLTRADLSCGPRGMLEPACNAAGEVDADVFGRAHLYRGGTAGYDPEGLPSTAGALATTLLGWVAGETVRTRARRDALLQLAGLALGCLVASGLLWQSTPINKRLWTPPFALFTAWVVIAGLAVLYALVDRAVDGPPVTPWQRALAWPFTVFGRNALVVYIAQHIVGVALVTTLVGDVAIPASAWLVDHVFAPWVAPPGAYIAYALAAVVVWWSLAWVMHLLRWHVRL